MARTSFGNLFSGPWRWGIAIGVGLLLLLVGAAWPRGRMAAEDRRAAEWMAGIVGGQSTTRFAELQRSGSDVTAAALARTLVRRDTSVGKLYRAGRDVLPSWLRRRLPRPQDERFRGSAAALGLLNHADAAEAFPILAAALTDPRCVNRGQAAELLNHLGDWLPEALRARTMKGLADPDPRVRLRVLEPLERVWPGQPDLSRRIGELRREQARQAAALPGATNRPTVPAN